MNLCWSIKKVIDGMYDSRHAAVFAVTRCSGREPYDKHLCAVMNAMLLFAVLVSLAADSTISSTAVKQ
jgi:hypothetical protein